MTVKEIIKSVEAVENRHKQSVITIQNMLIVSPDNTNTEALKKLEKLFKDFLKDLADIKKMLNQIQ